jgi:hypothetical protein
MEQLQIEYTSHEVLLYQKGFCSVQDGTQTKQHHSMGYKVMRQLSQRTYILIER